MDFLTLHRFSSKIPVTFMTGFYVTTVVSRYWDQFISLPTTDKLSYKLVATIPGKVSPNVLFCCEQFKFSFAGHLKSPSICQVVE